MQYWIWLLIFGSCSIKNIPFAVPPYSVCVWSVVWPSRIGMGLISIFSTTWCNPIGYLGATIQFHCCPSFLQDSTGRCSTGQRKRVEMCKWQKKSAMTKKLRLKTFIENDENITSCLFEHTIWCAFVDMVWRDVVPMDSGDILLGKPVNVRQEWDSWAIKYIHVYSRWKALYTPSIHPMKPEPPKNRSRTRIIKELLQLCYVYKGQH